MSHNGETQDEFSTSVFDSESFKGEESSTEIGDCKSVLFSSTFSRSVGDLQQIQEDLYKFASKSQIKRTCSLKKFDINDIFVERAHHKVDKWLKHFPGASKKEKFDDLLLSSVPLSPSCYRRIRKQKPIPKELLQIDLSLVKTQLRRDTPKNRRMLPSPQIHFSRKNETSEEISCQASATLDEYSNSIFIEDEDPTVGDNDHSDFGDDCNSSDFDHHANEENRTPTTPINPNAFRSRSQETKSPGKNDIPECVSYNPLFNSQRAQCFIDTRKQPWRIPDEEIVETRENPLFKNFILHQILVKDRVAWQVPSETPKAKRRMFFKRQSLSDILQSRTLKNPKYPEESIPRNLKGNADTAKKIKFAMD